MYPKGNKNQIKKLMDKDVKLKNQIVRSRREDSYDEKVREWKSQDGSVEKMKGDSAWGYSSPTPSGKFIGKQKRLSESERISFELDRIIEELES